jgi:hypothetical protein
MGDLNSPERPEEAQLAQQKTLIINIVRGAGVMFMLAAPVIGFNLGGIAAGIGFGDPFVQKALGGALIFAGLLDFFVVPQFLDKMKR